jgi:diguanylate cyclase (GGDEF)-like protein/PAS domain S-box-containing protein
MMSIRPKILLVDDSEHDCFAYCRALQPYDYETCTATSMTDGLILAIRELPDVILLDYNLPDGDGFAFIQALTLQNPDFKPSFIMVTGYGDEAVAVQAMKMGAVDYLIKDAANHYLKLLPSVIRRVLNDRTILRAKERAEQQVRLAASVYHYINEGIVVTDVNGVIVLVNPALCAITGYTAEECIGQNPRLFKSHRHDAGFYQTLWHTLKEAGSWQGDVWNQTKTGRLFVVHETISVIHDDNNRVQNYVAVMVDVTEARLSQEFMRHQAYHDPLTNLPNRALLLERLGQQMVFSERKSSNFAVLFIDLDGFKAINDTLGHEMGDVLLIEVAKRLQACVRKSDTVGRLGGDEFVAILNDATSPNSAELVAQKMLDQLGEAFILSEQPCCISASIGIALYPTHGKTAGMLLQSADSAMYLVKQHGRSNYATLDI